MKLRSSTKIATGFAMIVALGIVGYKVGMNRMIEGASFDPIIPGEVNLVGIDPGAGYRIIVANQMAQLVEASDTQGAKETESGGATEGAIKKRIPIKEMLAVLRGDEKALGPFVMSLNDMSENDLPPVAPVWTADRLQKAVDGDAATEAELVRDLNMKLDGTPLTQLRIASLENGIIVEAPVKVEVNLGGKVTELVGIVREAYKPRLMKTVESRYADRPNLTKEIQAGTYLEEAKKVFDGEVEKEDIRSSIVGRISEELGRKRAVAAERVLKSATVVVNEGHIENASLREYDTTDGKRYDITVAMKDEGRMRLWKYSHDRVGTQLLLIADGVAIAAPRIQHELAQGQLTMTQMRDKVLVTDAVQMLNAHTKGIAKQ